MRLCAEIVPEVIPLTEVPNYHYYNIFAHEDFYERFLKVLV